MEEIEYKLTKKNTITVTSAFAQLQNIIRNNIIEQRKKSTVINTTSKELTFLKQKCYDSDYITSLTACHTIITLMKEGYLETNIILNDFIIALSSAKNFTVITKTISDILLYDIKTKLESENVYQSSYNIYSPQHPFITLLRLNKDTWVEIINQLNLLCFHLNPRVSTANITALQPVFTYILCNPNSDVPNECKYLLWKLILSLKNEKLTFSILQWLQKNSPILETSKLYLDLVESTLKENNFKLLTALAVQLTSVLHDLIVQNHDPTPCLNSLFKVVEISETSTVWSLMLMILSEVLIICPSTYLYLVVKLCNKIVMSDKVHILSQNMVAASLLQWLAHSSNIIENALDLSSEIVMFVKNNSCNNNTVPLISNGWFHLFKENDEKIHCSHELLKLSNIIINDNQTLNKWLNNILQNNQDFYIRLFPFLSGLFVFNNNSKSCEIIVTIFLHLVKINTEYATNILTLILYKISNETNYENQLILLNAIPEMAVAKENIPLILNTIKVMSSKSHLLKMQAVDLFLKLVKIEVRCYSYLQKLLVESNKNDFEFNIVKAVALKELCISRPHNFGHELVALLSQVLNDCGNKEGSIASSLAIQGIKALCDAGIIDIVSTWSALSKKLDRDKRPLVVQSLCELFSEVPVLCIPVVEYDEFITSILHKLWSYVTDYNDTTIIGAALQSLSHFNIDIMSLNHLPHSFKECLKSEEEILYVPGRCWVQMLYIINGNALEAAGNLLIKWMDEEISNYRSGVYTIAENQTEPSSYRSLPDKSFVKSITEYIRIEFSKLHSEHDKSVFLQCMRIISQTYKKPLPPLNWSFLHEIFHLGELEKEYCIAIASKQSLSSGSARRFIENILNNFECSKEKETQILILFLNYAYLCKAISPNILHVFTKKAMNYALAKETNENILFERIMECIKITVSNTDVPETSREVLSELVMSLFGKIHKNHQLFESYVDCLINLEQQYLKDITAFRQNLTGDDFQKLVYIRCLIIEKKNDKKNLSWLNDCIDKVINEREQNYLFEHVSNVLIKTKENIKTVDWIMELMVRIQAATADKSIEQQLTEFLCDMFILSIIILSSSECLTLPFENIIMSKEIRCSLFSQAIVLLLQKETWTTYGNQIIEWLYHMSTSAKVSLLYKNTFHLCLSALKHDNYYKKGTIWMKVASNLLENYILE